MQSYSRRRAYSRKHRTMKTSPNMLMKKIRLKLPVAGPRAENTNIFNPSLINDPELFCNYLLFQHDIPHGKTTIEIIPNLVELRNRKRRGGRDMILLK